MHISRRAALGAAIALALAAGSRPASAQDCRTRDVDPCADLVPTLDITSVAGAQTSTATAQFQVMAADDHAVSSVSLTLNGSGGAFSGTLSAIGAYARSGTLTATLASGVNTISGTVCDDSGTNPCTTVSIQVTYTPVPSPPSRQAPAVSLTSHDRWHSASLHGSTLGYSTPAYVSLDQARSVTLLYASNQAAPAGFVQVEAMDNSSDPIQHMSITVLDGNGVVVAPERFYQAGTGANQLAAQWDVSTLATGAYLYTVEIRSYWATGSPLSSTLQARVIVLNEAQPFGRGWSLAGLKRIVTDTSGAALVVNGDGTASYYARVALQYVRPDGEAAELGVYNGSGDLEQVYPDGSRARFVGGRLSTVRDRFGNTTTYAYTSGRVSSITDPAGQQITFTYTGNLLASIQSPKGTSTFAYSTPAQTLSSASDVGPAFQAYYATDGKLSYWLDRNSERWDVSYDAFGRVDSLVAPTVSVNGSAARPVTAVRGIPAAALAQPGTGTTRGTAVARRSIYSLTARVTDARGVVTETRVDRYGNPLAVSAPYGSWTSILRDANGRIRSVQDNLGRSETYTWTAQGLPLSSANGVTGHHVRIEYDTLTPSGAPAITVPVRVTSGGAVQEYGLGTRGEVMVVVFAGDTVQSFTYDSLGRVLTATDANGYATTYAYHGSGSRNTASVTVTTALGNQTTSFVHDSAGYPSRVTDPLGQAVELIHDDLGRILFVTDPLGGITAYEHAGVDGTVTDAAGKTHYFGDNALGWRVSEIDPGGEETSFTHDAVGNVLSTTDRRGLTVTFAYDSLSRVVSRTADGATTTYAYDNPNGRWVAASNAESTDTLHFDAFGRDTLNVTRMGGQRYAVRSRYNAAGSRTSLDILSPFTRSVAYTYNPGTLRLERVQDIGGGATDVRYNTLGQVTKEIFPGAIGERRHYYNERNLPSNVWYSAAGLHNTLMRDYQFDGLDRVAGITYRYNDTTTAFAYDSVGRLVSRKSYEIESEMQCTDPQDDTTCQYVDVPTLRGETAFAYDAVGNRTDSGAALATNHDRYTSFGGFTFTYDDEGNPLTKSRSGISQSFTWNALGQLASVTTNGTTVGYGYDGWGTRVRRTQGGTVGRFLYDGDDLLVELDGSGSPVREYTHLPGVDQPHHVKTGGVSYYYAQDLLGNVIGAFSSGGVALHRGYLPFGGLTESTGSLSQPLGFKGREADAATGLYYMRNRWYDVDQARFVSEDPIGIAGGMNVYAFAENDPVNRSDPYGLASDPDPIVSAALAGCLTAPDIVEIEWCLRNLVQSFTDQRKRGGSRDRAGEMLGRAYATGLADLWNVISAPFSANTAGGNRDHPLEACMGYKDYGVSGGSTSGLGAAAGVMVAGDGTYVYLGFGASTPGFDVSVSRSYDAASSGPFVATTGTLGFQTVQRGYGGLPPTRFSETGVSTSLFGVSAMGGWVTKISDNGACPGR